MQVGLRDTGSLWSNINKSVLAEVTETNCMCVGMKMKYPETLHVPVDTFLSQLVGSVFTSGSVWALRDGRTRQNKYFGQEKC